MSKKLLFNFNREVIQNYTYVKYVGAIITATNTLEKPIKSAILKGNTERILVGKNIFDKTSKLYDGWLYQNGDYREDIGGIFYTTDFIKVKPNTDIVVNNGSGYAQYDDNKKCVYNVTYGSTTTLSNTKYIRVVVKKEVIDTLQIEYGTVSTDYEEPNYELQSVKMPVLTTSNEDGTKTNILSVNEPVELRGVGDVRDTLDCLTGEVTTKYGEMVIDGREEFIWGHSWSNRGTVYPLDNPTILDNYNFKKGGNLIWGQFQILDDFNYDDKIDICPDVDRGIVLVVPNELTGGKNNVAGLRAWLNENPITIVYELNQQSIKTVDLSILDQNENKVSSISSFNDTTHITASSETIPPIFEGYLATKEVE